MSLRRETRNSQGLLNNGHSLTRPYVQPALTYLHSRGGVSRWRLIDAMARQSYHKSCLRDCHLAIAWQVASSDERKRVHSWLQNLARSGEERQYVLVRGGTSPKAKKANLKQGTSGTTFFRIAENPVLLDCPSCSSTHGWCR